MINRKERIKAKGFDMAMGRGFMPEDLTGENIRDFAAIKVGAKSLDNAVLIIGDLERANSELANKKNVLNAIQNLDYEQMREISNFFFKTSGIYSRLCRYAAYLYRYDWYVTPQQKDMKDQLKKIEKLKDQFFKVLNYMDNFQIKRQLGDIALKVIRNGCYYGYLVKNNDVASLQELPIKYCRSRYSVNGKATVEFNMKYFDDAFKDKDQRERMLKLFPPEFAKGYKLYKNGKLKPDFVGDQQGWYLLDVKSAVKFNINGEDYPFFIAVIPMLIDLDAAQELDRRKMQQQLLKIVIQKMPFDKNGDPVFDVDEAKQLHNNAIAMLGKAIGIDVLTTFAEVEVVDVAETTQSAQNDELEKVERAVYNEAGVSHMQFNTDGNIALNMSETNDESSLYNLITQFESFLNEMIVQFNNKQFSFRTQILPTTWYNYKDLVKMYKEQMQLGYSKMLTQVAMGHTQSSILYNAYFENDGLDLVNVFIPPLMSSTMNADILNRNKNGGTGEEGQVGRKEKDDNEKSEKTIQNRESMS